MKPPNTNRHTLTSDPGGTRYIVTTTLPSSAPAYSLTMQQTLAAYHNLHAAGGSPREFSQQGHLVPSLIATPSPQQLIGLQHMQQQQQQQHMEHSLPLRRPSGGMRVSLLRDIGKAGERDRAETSMPSSHSFLQGAYSSSHVPHEQRSAIGLIPNLSSNLLAETARQTGSLTPPHHVPAHQLHAYGANPRFQSPMFSPLQQATYISSSKPTIKSEPEVTYIKDETPMQLTTGAHQQITQQQQHLITSSQSMFSAQSSSKRESSEKEGNNNPMKEDLLSTMEKFDRDIIKINHEIARLERKKEQLEEAAKKPSEPEKEIIPPKKAIPKHQELWQVIYAENKKKAESAKGLLGDLGKWYDMPLYNQPCDTQVYQDNLKKNEEMRPKLLAYFKKRATLTNIRDKYLSTRYDELMEDWQKKIEKIKNIPKRKAKEAKVRDFFEKQFPEIRKQREQQDRFQRGGNRGDSCRSDADFAEIVDVLSEQENHEQHMRQLAVVPPMLLDKEERRIRYINKNGLITDAFKDYKEQQQLDDWSEAEKSIFKEKYIQHPKNFNLIASCLEKKSVSDCVLFYYLMKKKINYKSLARKNSLKPRKPKSGRGSSNQNQNQDLSSKTDKGDKDDSKNSGGKEEEEDRLDRPPSPRITRSKNRTLNWTDEDIVIAKEGFSKHGNNYAAISRMFTNKNITENQVKTFYNTCKKKYNLDQLINSKQQETKKRREGGRRSRAANQTESTDVESTITEDDSSKDSNDIALSVLANKKRKDNTESPLTVQEDVVMSTEASDTNEVTTTTTTPQPTSNIRTRRAAAASSMAETKNDSAKRPSDSQAPEEPAEKKTKKSRTSTPTKKADKAEPETTSTTMSKTQIKATETKSSKEDAPVTTKETTPTITSSVSMSTKTSTTVTSSISETVTPVLSKPSDTNKPDDVKPPESSIDKPTMEVENTATESLKMKTAATEKPSPQTAINEDKKVAENAEVSKPEGVKTTVKVLNATSLPIEVPKPPDSKIPGKSHADDDDSSATCSADEESASLSDFADTAKTTHKHSESPYAFEDESSSMIRLETKPKQSPSQKPVSFTPTVPSQTVPKTTVPASAVENTTVISPGIRTIAQSTWIPPKEDNRPSSVPSAHPAVKPAVLPAKAPPKQQTESRPRSTPIVAIQELTVPGTFAQSIPRMPMQVKPSQAQFLNPGGSISQQQPPIALQLPTKAKPDESAIPHHPRYHHVTSMASSISKDFAPTSTTALPRTKPDNPPTGPRSYTEVDRMAMRDRAATIPVPITELRFPTEPQHPAHFMKPDFQHQLTIQQQQQKLVQQSIAMSMAPSSQPVFTIQQGKTSDDARPFGFSIMQGKPVSSSATITTSAVPTKFVTSVPVTQPKSVLQIQEGLSRSIELTPQNLIRAPIAFAQPGISIPVSMMTIGADTYSRSRSGSDVGKMVRGSIVQGTPIENRKASTPGKRDTANAQPENLRAGPNSQDIPAGSYASKDIIKGREIIVKTAKPSAPERQTVREEKPKLPLQHIYNSQLPHGGATQGPLIMPSTNPPMLKPDIPAGSPLSKHGGSSQSLKGSILQGTPIPRKTSDDSASSLSPSLPNTSSFSSRGSQISPTLNPSILRGERHPHGLPINPSPTQMEAAMRHLRESPFAADKSKKEEHPISMHSSSSWADLNKAAVAPSPQAADLRRVSSAVTMQSHQIKIEATSPRPQAMYTVTMASAGQPLLRPGVQSNYADFLRLANPSYFPYPAAGVQIPQLVTDKSLLENSILQHSLLQQYKATTFNPLLTYPLRYPVPQVSSQAREVNNENILNNVLSYDIRTARLMDKTAHSGTTTGNATPSSAPPQASTAISASALRQPLYNPAVYQRMSYHVPQGHFEASSNQRLMNFPPHTAVPLPTSPSHGHLPGTHSPHRSSRSPGYISRSPDMANARNRSSEDLTNWKNTLGRSPGSPSLSPRMDPSQSDKYANRQSAGRQHSPSPRSVQSPRQEYSRTPPVKKPEPSRWQQYSSEAHQIHLANQQRGSTGQIQNLSTDPNLRRTPEFHHSRSGSYDRGRIFENPKQNRQSPSYHMDSHRTNSPITIADKHPFAVSTIVDKDSDSKMKQSEESKVPSQPAGSPMNKPKKSPAAYTEEQKKYKQKETGKQYTGGIKGDELKSKGRTQTTAQNLIDAIIIHQMDRGQGNGASSPDKKTETSPKDTNMLDISQVNKNQETVRRSNVPPIHPIMMMQLHQQQQQLAANAQQQVSRQSPLSHPVKPSQAQSQSEIQHPKKKMAATNMQQMRTLEQHSSSIILDMYSKPSESQTRQSNTDASKEVAKSYKTEPISPPNQKKQQDILKQSTTPVPSSSTFTTSIASSKPAESPKQAAISPMLAYGIPHHLNPAPSNSSLEQIIRAALMDKNSSPIGFDNAAAMEKLQQQHQIKQTQDGAQVVPENKAKSMTMPVSSLPPSAASTDPKKDITTQQQQQQSSYMMMSALFVNRPTKDQPQTGAPSPKIPGTQQHSFLSQGGSQSRQSPYQTHGRAESPRIVPAKPPQTAPQATPSARQYQQPAPTYSQPPKSAPVYEEISDGED